MPRLLHRVRRRALRAVTLAALAASGCGGESPSAPAPLGRPVLLEGGSRLVFEDEGRLAQHHGTIERVVRETVRVVRVLLPVDDTTILVTAGLQGVIPELGMGGRAEPTLVRLSFDPASPALVASLEDELVPLLAHELHHVARLRARPPAYSTLLEAMVTEGLADHFSVELAGIAPPLWSSALTPAELELWSERAEAQWHDANYDHAAWFFGNGTIPRWAGYSIGFDLVGKYLAEAPGRTAANAFAEPVESFIP